MPPEDIINEVTPLTTVEYNKPLFPPIHVYPQYIDKEERAKSFQTSEGPIIPSARVQIVAGAGFFYAGPGDLVRCFSCGTGLRNWDQPDDDPRVEHAQWSPNCPYLKGKGVDFTRQDRNNDSKADAQSESQQFYHKMGTSAQASAPEDPITSPVAQRVIEMGFSGKDVKMAIEKCIRRELHWDEEMLVVTLLGEQDQGEGLPIAQSLPVAPEATGGEDEQKNQVTCIMCEVNYPNVVFWPCTHHRMCEDCAQDVSVCPMCGTNVCESEIKAFLN